MIQLYCTKYSHFGAAYFWFGPFLFRVLKSQTGKYYFSIEFNVFIKFRRVIKWGTR